MMQYVTQRNSMDFKSVFTSLWRIMELCGTEATGTDTVYEALATQKNVFFSWNAFIIVKKPKTLTLSFWFCCFLIHDSKLASKLTSYASTFFSLNRWVIITPYNRLNNPVPCDTDRQVQRVTWWERITIVPVQPSFCLSFPPFISTLTQVHNFKVRPTAVRSRVLSYSWHKSKRNHWS